MISNSNHKVASPQSQVLLAKDLRKSYGSTPALQGLSFSLSAGRVLGFLGPNGAGKTTAIRILTTILEPSSGTFSVAGIGAKNAREIRTRIGVLPESLGFPKRITGMEFLTYFGRLYGRKTNDARMKAQALLREVGLEKRARSLIGTYSRGMRQRLGIARALVNNPVVLFLDEPTLGLDPRGQQDLLGLVRRIVREQKVGIILCTHALSEVEEVCDDVVILNQGQIVAVGTVAEVIKKVRRSTIRIHVPSSSIAKAQRVLQGIPEVKKVTPAANDRGLLGIELADFMKTSPEGDHQNNVVLKALINAEINVLNFDTEGGRLQDAFLHLTENQAGN